MQENGKNTVNLEKNQKIYRLLLEWKGEPDWLGYEAATICLPSRVKELLKGLIESRAIYELPSIVMLSLVPLLKT